jgi:hypothetical protein
MQDITIQVSDEFYEKYVRNHPTPHCTSPKQLIDWVLKKEARTQARLRTALSMMTRIQKLAYNFKCRTMKDLEVWQ